MSLEDTIDAIRQVVNKIESAPSFNQEERVADSIKPYTTQQDHVNTTEAEDNLLQYLNKTLLPVKQEQHQKLNALIEKTSSKSEKLNNKKAAIQARIESIEKHLKQPGGQTNQNHLVQKLQEKNNCMLGWRLLTGVNFDFSNQNVSGYHFNKKNGKYATFEIAREGDFSGKLWSLLNKNTNEEDA